MGRLITSSSLQGHSQLGSTPVATQPYTSNIYSPGSGQCVIGWSRRHAIALRERTF